MNILWITNIPLPEASLLINEESLPFGGWLVTASNLLSEQGNIEQLSIAFPKNDTPDIQVMQGANIRYYSFPIVKTRSLESDEHNKYLIKLINEVKPDIVHIFGTEDAHALAVVNICKSKNIKTVISIQGLISILAKHYMSGIPWRILSRYTFRDFIKQDNIIQQKNKIAQRGKFEIEALQKVNHVIGRTTWDRACTSQINPDVQYHHCNETLRSEFYQHQWDINQCEKHSIFLSQGSYPIKGLHFMIEAMPYILKRYPNTKLYIGGKDITKSKTFKERLKLSSYGKYIIELINKYHLQRNVIFTGILNEKQMCERYLKSNVFVCSSSIENSPNSLGEAMILGLPCIASDVGGVSDMLKHKEDGFVYQTDAPYMLAHYVCEVFANENLAKKLSVNAKKHARKTHNQNENLNQLLKIYEEIIHDEI
nr:glycosyltransferase family 4 protein [Fredinandcohnia onubensis]